jgi:catechol 2,3-dioxygenase-like lactoylglutathione lyase family enzyme
MLACIDHVNIVVRDMKQMLKFYCDTLGMKVTKSVTISGDWVEAIAGLKGVVADVVYLDLPAGPRIELIKYVSPLGADLPQNSLANTVGLRHMAFKVEDIAASVKHFRARGVVFVSEPQTVPDVQVKYTGGVRKTLVYFRDPEGNLLELCEYRASPAP